VGQQSFEEVLAAGGTLPPFEDIEAAVRSPSQEDRPKKRPAGDSWLKKRFQCLNDFIDHSADVPDGEFRVWVIIYREVKMDKPATIPHSARRVGKTRTTVAKITKRLEDKGLIEVVKRGGLSGQCNAYRVLVPPPAA
jgi:hypothetical protein